MDSNKGEVTAEKDRGAKITGRQIFRLAALMLFIVAIVAYFMSSFWGSTSVGWLFFGVIHAAMFSAIFFRNARKRRAISIIFFILLLIWGAIFLLLLQPMLAIIMHVPILAPANLYAVCSLLAAILALLFPRKVSESDAEQSL